MKVIKNETGNAAIWAVVLVVGVVVGFAVARVMDKSKTNTTTASSSSSSAPTSATPAADLRANLVTLGLQHMDLTDQAVDAALDGSPNAAAAGAALYANGNTIGKAVGSVYGSSAETTFDSVWKLHLDDFVKYAVADKKGDAAGKQAALSDIATNYTAPLAQYLAKANPNLPENVLQTSLAEHVSMTATMIDDHVQGKYSDEAAELNQSDLHLEGLFSALAGGIVKQFPSKFQS